MNGIGKQTAVCSSIQKIIYWLEKVVEVAENDQQKMFPAIIEYYETGDLKMGEYNIACWVKTLIP